MGEQLDFLVRHGYALLFAVVLAGQLAVPIPSIPLLLAAGALAGSGRLNLGLALGVSVLAGLAGDAIFYALGRRFGARFLAFLCRVTLEEELCVHRAEQTWSRYGLWSLLVQRWLPLLGTVASPLAGSFRMPVGKFLLVDLVGTVVWTSLLLGLGYAFSEDLERVAGHVEHFELWFLAIFLAIPAAQILWKLVRRHMRGRRDRLTTRA